MKTTAIASGIAYLLLLTGCGGDELTAEERAQEERESAARIARAMETTTASPTHVRDEGAFLTAARRSGMFDAVSDATLLTAGRETCGALGRGVSPLEVALTAYEGLGSSGDGGLVILGVAGSTLCRQHLEAVTELSEQLGG